MKKFIFMTFSCVVKSSGSCLGAHKVTNKDLSTFLETDDEWIVSRTGIKERPIMGPKETLLDLAKKASLAAMEKTSISPEDLDFIIVATSGGDQTFPPLSVSLAQALGSSAMSFDINVACSGYVYALHVAKSLMMSSSAIHNTKPIHALVIGCECMSRLVSWEDRTTAVLFGDGAGATILTLEENTTSTEIGILQSVFYNLPMGKESLYVSDWEDKNIDIPKEENILHFLQNTLNPGNSYRQRGVIHMKGQDVFRHAVLYLEKISHEVLIKNNVSLEDVTWFIPHQANKRILESLCQRLNVPWERMLYTGYFHGNISSASIPLTLDYFWNNNLFSKGDLLLIQSFGAGFTCGATLIRL